MDIRNCLGLPCQALESNPFTWWLQEGKQIFPLLFQLAMKYRVVTINPEYFQPHQDIPGVDKAGKK